MLIPKTIFTRHNPVTFSVGMSADNTVRYYNSNVIVVAGYNKEAEKCIGRIINDFLMWTNGIFRYTTLDKEVTNNTVSIPIQLIESDVNDIFQKLVKGSFRTLDALREESSAADNDISDGCIYTAYIVDVPTKAEWSQDSISKFRHLAKYLRTTGRFLIFRVADKDFSNIPSEILDWVKGNSVFIDATYIPSIKEINEELKVAYSNIPGMRLNPDEVNKDASYVRVTDKGSNENIVRLIEPYVQKN